MKGRVYLGDEVGAALGVEKTYWHIMTHFSGWLTQPAHCMLAKLFSQALWMGEFPLRLPSLIFGLGGIVAIYFLAARLFDERTGVIASLLLGLSPYHVFYSQMARGYAMAATLSILSFFWILKLVETRKTSHAILYVASTLLALYCHLGSLGIIPGQILVALFIAYRRRREIELRQALLPVAISVAVVGALAAALYYPAMNDMLSYRNRFTGQEGRGFTFGFAPLTLATYAGGRGWSVYIFSLFAGLGFARELRKNLAGALTLILWPAGVFLFYYWNDSRVYPWAYTRFFFITLPVFIIAAAGGLAAAAKALSNRFGGALRSPTVSLCPLVLVFVLTTSMKTVDISFGEKDPRWPRVISELEADFPPSALIASAPIGSSSFRYYYNRAWPDQNRIAAPRKIIVNLEEGDGAWRGKIPVIYIVDTVPFYDGGKFDGFVKIKEGSSTILYRSDWRETSVVERLTDLEMITERIVRYLEEKDSELITSDWVYWRRGSEGQKMFAMRGSLSLYYSLLAATREKLGKGETAGDARRKSAEWSAKVRMPEKVRSSWTMLLPHADFLTVLRKT